MARLSFALLLCVSASTACSKHGGSAHDLGVDLHSSDLAHADGALPGACNGSVQSTFAQGPAPAAITALKLPGGFTIESIATIGMARELAALPNGDLLVGTSASSVYLVPNAEADGAAGAAVVFTTFGDEPVQGVAFAGDICTVYVATQHAIYTMPYADGQLAATGTQIGSVRQGTPTPGSDGDVHTSTSVAYSRGSLYAGVGSGCNACVEVDPTRATVQQMGPMGQTMHTRATRTRNAIALAVNPDTGTVFIGGAGQDNLPLGHPYEYFDAMTLHTGVADYGWPDCEENQHAYTTGADCSATVAPNIELPAYSTLIGASYYPMSQAGTHAFPVAYRSGFFISGHGSWHTTSGSYYTPPRVAFVPMNGDQPVTPVDWNDPTKQWTEFVGGFQLADGTTRIGRPTGVAVGAQGSLFVADDQTGYIYRIRPQ